ncbi:MAG: InlB B-repeat-containing protein [Oscillospiraceae bacterium]|nr:InlB B-repeat-containing protein [Oscillospiraceae bacterium]
MKKVTKKANTLKRIMAILLAMVMMSTFTVTLADYSDPCDLCGELEDSCICASAGGVEPIAQADICADCGELEEDCTCASAGGVEPIAQADICADCGELEEECVCTLTVPAVPESVSTLDELLEAIAIAEDLGKPAAILLANRISIPYGQSVEIKSEVPVTLTVDGNYRHINGFYATLTLGDGITLTRAEGYTGEGGGIRMEGGRFNMYGGSITNNISSEHGGGIRMEYGTFNMYGGSVTNNNSTSYYGGGVSAYSGTFNMYGGKISGNTAYYGGGIFMSTSATYNNTWVNIYGGEISGNTANYGGAIYISGKSLAQVSELVINPTHPDAIDPIVFRDNTASSGMVGMITDSATYAKYEQYINYRDYDWSFSAQYGYNNYDICGDRYGSFFSDSLATQTVVFNYVDSGEAAGGTTRFVIPGETISSAAMPTVPNREGFSFLAWNTEEDGSGDEFTEATVVTGNMTVYAIYEAATTPPVPCEADCDCDDCKAARKHDNDCDCEDCKHAADCDCDADCNATDNDNTNANANDINTTAADNTAADGGEGAVNSDGQDQNKDQSQDDTDSLLTDAEDGNGSQTTAQPTTEAATADTETTSEPTSAQSTEQTTAPTTKPKFEMIPEPTPERPLSDDSFGGGDDEYLSANPPQTPLANIGQRQAPNNGLSSLSLLAMANMAALLILLALLFLFVVWKRRDEEIVEIEEGEDY